MKIIKSAGYLKKEAQYGTHESLVDLYENTQEDTPSLNDPHMETWKNETAPPIGNAPYAVGWSAQSWEWYGGDDGTGDMAGPETGRGRYKPKGDGGEIVAINVPDYNTALAIKKRIDQAAQKAEYRDFEPLKYEHGKHGFLLDDYSSWIEPMSNAENMPKGWSLQYPDPDRLDMSQTNEINLPF